MRNGLIYGVGFTLAALCIGTPFETGCMTSGDLTTPGVGQVNSADQNSDGGFCVEGLNGSGINGQTGVVEPVEYLVCNEQLALSDGGVTVCPAGDVCNYVPIATNSGSASGTCTVTCSPGSSVLYASVTYAWNCDQTPCDNVARTCAGESSCTMTYGDSQCPLSGSSSCQSTTQRQTSITIACGTPTVADAGGD